MPKKSLVPQTAIIEVLCASKNTVIRNGNIATPSDGIWAELSKQLGEKLTPKALYTFVKLNRHNILATLGYNNEKNMSETDSSESDTPFDQSMSTLQNKGNKTFNVELPFEQWMHMIPERVTYKKDMFRKRAYTILKRGTWTHIVNQGIWNEIKSSCTFIFKRAKVYPDQVSSFIKIRGFCKECKGQLYITCEKEPDMQCPMVLRCVMENTDESLHTGFSKRPLSGRLHEEVKKELCEGRLQPHVWRASQAEKLMDFGDPEPSHLPNLATIRKAKQEQHESEMAHKNPILSLQAIKCSCPHSGSIGDIGLHKFFCHYWSPTQMMMYQTEKHPIVAFDATGSVVKKLVRPNGLSGHIFLYQGVLIGSDNSHIPVVQMLSERHDVQAITRWLTEWIHAGAPVPKEAISDFSLALLGALVKAFTQLSDLKSHVNECFGVLLQKKMQQTATMLHPSGRGTPDQNDFPVGLFKEKTS